jgi:chromatin segregation and condensation protein Rec8/ScpA/Scc1 (kleisin family)
VRSAVASTLVAALELCRDAVVGLDQREAFGTITLSLRAARAAEPDANAAYERHVCLSPPSPPSFG